MKICDKRKKKPKPKPKHGPYSTCVWDQARSKWRLSLTESGKRFVEHELSLFEDKPIRMFKKNYSSVYEVCLSAGYSDEEINAVCQAAFVKAALRFDPKRGLKFITYATYHLRSHVQHTLIGNRKDKSGNSSQIIQFQAAQRTVTEPDKPDYMSIFPSEQDDPTINAIRNEQKSKLKELILRLPKRQQQVIRLRRVQGLTLQETGKLMGGISKERVRQIETQAFQKLRIVKSQLA